MRMKHGICVLCLCFAIILAAGCTIRQNAGGSGDTGISASASDRASSGSGAVKETVTIRIKDSSFDPPSVTIPAGTTVVWTNEDTLAHRVTSTGKGPVLLDSSSLTPGQSYTVIFSRAGRYDYADSQHSFMTGTIIVV